MQVLLRLTCCHTVLRRLQEGAVPIPRGAADDTSHMLGFLVPEGAVLQTKSGGLWPLLPRSVWRVHGFLL